MRAREIDNDDKVTRHGPEDDIVRKVGVMIDFTEYGFPTIFAGFQQLWGEAEGVDGTKVEVSTGAGLGSLYGTVRIERDGTKRYFTFNVNEVVNALMARLDAEEEVSDDEEGR